MSAHTGGEWKIGASTSRGTIIYAEDTSQAVPGNRWLAYVIDCPGSTEFPSREESAANAKIFASAKKLAEVLLRAYQNVSHGGPTRAEVEAVLKEAGLL